MVLCMSTQPTRRLSRACSFVPTLPGVFPSMALEGHWEARLYQGNDYKVSQAQQPEQLYLKPDQRW